VHPVGQLEQHLAGRNWQVGSDGLVFS